MIRGKLISPVNLQLERPVLNPVDSPDWVIMPKQEYESNRQDWFISGAIAGAFLVASIAILIFSWQQVVTR